VVLRLKDCKIDLDLEPLELWNEVLKLEDVEPLEDLKPEKSDTIKKPI
jgi:hypothetical protein